MKKYNNKMIIYAQPTIITIISYIFVLCFGLILGCVLVKYCSKQKREATPKWQQSPEVRFTPIKKVKTKSQTFEEIMNDVKSVPIYTVRRWCYNCGRYISVRIPKGRTTKSYPSFICRNCGIKGDMRR